MYRLLLLRNITIAPVYIEVLRTDKTHSFSGCHSSYMLWNYIFAVHPDKCRSNLICESGGLIVFVSYVKVG